MVYECCRDNSRPFCDICLRGGWGDNTLVQRSDTMHVTLLATDTVRRNCFHSATAEIGVKESFF